MPVVIDDYPGGPGTPAVYPPAPPGTPPSAGQGAPTAPPATNYGQHWRVVDPGHAAYTPDYTPLFRATPQYLFWRGQANKAIASLTHGRQMNIREFVRQYGYYPGMENDSRF